MLQRGAELSAVCLLFVCLTAVPAGAQTTRCYTASSLQGSYGAVIHYAQNGSNGLIAESLDGAGNLSGTFVLNQTSLRGPGGRAILSGTLSGTYTVACDGTGVMNRVMTFEDGSTLRSVDDLLITDGTPQISRMLATSISAASRTPVGDGAFVNLTHTRLPSLSGQCFTLSSLQGTYAVAGTYGNDVATTLGTRTLDGGGNLVGTYIVNQPAQRSPNGERTVVSGTHQGTYTVRCDGSGVFNRIVTLPDGSTTPQLDDFQITQAEVRGGRLVATAIVDAQRTPSAVVAGGVFLTRTHTLLPDARVGVGLVGSGQ